MSTFNEQVVVKITDRNGKEYGIGIKGETFLERPGDYDKAAQTLLNIAWLVFVNMRNGRDVSYGMNYLFPEDFK